MLIFKQKQKQNSFFHKIYLFSTNIIYYRSKTYITIFDEFWGFNMIII